MEYDSPNTLRDDLSGYVQDWDWLPHLIQIPTLPDGSCFFHAIANAMFIPYRHRVWNGKRVTPTQIVMKFRQDLAQCLTNKNPGTGKIYYETINGGLLPELSQTLPDCRLDYLQNELCSSSAVDNRYNDFICQLLHIDMYIIDIVKKDVVITGDEKFDKMRPFIVLIYVPGHYELAGYRTDKGIITYFDCNHPWKKILQQKIESKKNSK